MLKNDSTSQIDIYNHLSILEKIPNNITNIDGHNIINGSQQFNMFFHEDGNDLYPREVHYSDIDYGIKYLEQKRAIVFHYVAPEIVDYTGDFNLININKSGFNYQFVFDISTNADARLYVLIDSTNIIESSLNIIKTSNVDTISLNSSISDLTISFDNIRRMFDPIFFFSSPSIFNNYNILNYIEIYNGSGVYKYSIPNYKYNIALGSGEILVNFYTDDIFRMVFYINNKILMMSLYNSIISIYNSHTDTYYNHNHNMYFDITYGDSEQIDENISGIVYDSNLSLYNFYGPTYELSLTYKFSLLAAESPNLFLLGHDYPTNSIFYHQKYNIDTKTLENVAIYNLANFGNTIYTYGRPNELFLSDYGQLRKYDITLDSWSSEASSRVFDSGNFYNEIGYFHDEFSGNLYEHSYNILLNTWTSMFTSTGTQGPGIVISEINKQTFKVK